MDKQDILDFNTSICSFAKELIMSARKSNLTLRLYGGCAVWLKNNEYHELLAEKRRKLKDIDFIAFSTQKEQIKAFFQQESYIQDKLSPVTSHYVSKFYKNNLTIEVVYDSLRYCHDINLKGVVFYDPFTINLSDLILSKLQITELTESDYIDILALLNNFINLKNQEQDKELESIISVLSTNWGFYYTVKLNITWLKTKLNDDLKFNSIEKIDNVLNYLETQIDKSKKSTSWKLRSFIGSKIKFYNEVN